MVAVGSRVGVTVGSAVVGVCVTGASVTVGDGVIPAVKS